MTSHRRTTNPPTGRLEPLDGLRAVAVGVVFLHHLDDWVVPGGFFGVTVFFTISGYLITTLLLREWERTDGIWLRGFYTRRFLRLMPALVVLVVVITPIAWALSFGSPADAAAALFYVMDFYAAIIGHNGYAFGHTWSLAVEEQFYLVWPAVLVVGLRRRWHLARIAFAFGAACVVFTALLTVGADPQRIADVYWLPTTHVSEIFVGVLLAFIFNTEDGHQRLRAVATTWPPWLAALAFVVASLKVGQSSVWLYRGGFCVAALVFATMVAHVVLAPQSLFSRMMSMAPVVWLGRRSYGFYLWHYPILQLSHAHFRNNRYEWFAFGVITTFVATEVSWRFVEQPFLRLKDRHFEPARRGHTDPTENLSEVPSAVHQAAGTARSGNAG